MRGSFVGKVVLAGAGILLAGAMSMGAALASPTCTTINNLGPDGSGSILKSSFTAGYCVQAHDKIYGNFDLSKLPSSTVVQFNFNQIGNQGTYQIAFDSTYKAGKTYNWSYEVMVGPSAPAGTKIISLASDFDQTKSDKPSILTETLNPAATDSIHEVKKDAITQTGSVTEVFFTTPVTDLLVSLHLVDHGSINSVTNTMVQFEPSHNVVPEPLSLSLFGAGLAGLGGLRRRRRRN